MISENWPAPAKLNLMLHITGQRSDGYHTLQTVFQFIDHYDWLDFSIRSDGIISLSSDWQDVKSENNLVMRAAKILQKKSVCCLGVDISLQKNIPVGGGLGGGSSDAATTLIALNYLWKLGYSIDQLAAIGLTLGADIPVFVHGYAAWAEGIGEQLTPIDLPEYWYLVIQPDCCVETARIFNDYHLSCDPVMITVDKFLRDGGHNDCQSVVRCLYPEVAKALDWLQKFAIAKISGTGGCVFAQFEQSQQAQAVYHALPETWRGFVAHGVRYSPLLARLAQESGNDNASVKKSLMIGA